MKKIILSCAMLITLSACSVDEITPEKPKIVKPKIDSAIIKQAKMFCFNNGMSTSFFLIADLSKHSGRKRLYLWDFKKGPIDSFMVSHGCGPNPWGQDHSKESPVISNTVNSHCSSLGRYRLDERGYSNFGGNIKYMLDGLDTSNNNARKRSVVFHSWEAVTDYETYPNGTAEGWGCPAVSIKAFEKIDSMILSNDESILLWMIK